MRYLFLLLFSLAFFGCSGKEIKPNIRIKAEQEIVVGEKNNVISPIELVNKIDINKYEISDLKEIPQNVSFYTKNFKAKRSLYKIQKKYEKHYFSIWNIKKHKDSLNASRWPFALHKPSNSYGGNFQPLNKDYFNKMYKYANFGEYSTLNLRAITLREANIRSFPTITPLFRDPTLAGEGYPFDYLQNSTIHANKPIFISHYSTDGAWAFIFTSFTSGWIKASDFVILDKKYTDIWQKAQQITITKEDIPIYDTNGNFLFKSKIGMMFSLVRENKHSYTILTVAAYNNTSPIFLESEISKDISHKGSLKFNKKNLNSIIGEVSRTYYGWGGLDGQRDCSSMLRDMYAPFGIWLPRNSSKQASIGKVINLENLNDKDKEIKIMTDAIPFETLLYKKGHVMLYVGRYKDRVIIFHNLWGIKTKKDGVEGRYVIGRAIFSTLSLGQHIKNYDNDAKILKMIKSINILTK